MRSHICAMMLIGILGVVPLCYAQPESTNTSIEEVKKETQDLLQTIGSYTADQKDEAVQKAKESLNKLDKRIDALEARIDRNWDKMNEAARKEARENLKALRKQLSMTAVRADPSAWPSDRFKKLAAEGFIGKLFFKLV